LGAAAVSIGRIYPRALAFLHDLVPVKIKGMNKKIKDLDI
jgi:hypothetical protein